MSSDNDETIWRGFDDEVLVHPPKGTTTTNVDPSTSGASVSSGVCEASEE